MVTFLITMSVFLDPIKPLQQQIFQSHYDICISTVCVHCESDPSATSLNDTHEGRINHRDRSLSLWWRQRCRPSLDTRHTKSSCISASSCETWSMHLGLLPMAGTRTFDGWLLPPISMWRAQPVWPPSKQCRSVDVTPHIQNHPSCWTPAGGAALQTYSQCSCRGLSPQKDPTPGLMLCVTVLKFLIIV